jgi:hypothetical protein
MLNDAGASPSTPTASTTTGTAASTPPATQQNTDVSGLAIAALLSGAVIAAVVGAIVNTLLARRKSLEEERARVRTTFAEAFEAVSAYKEFPYAIRRRRSDEPAQERIRLSEELRQVQTRLTYYVAWTKAESATVGNAYEALVKQLRAVAGTACHDAWLAPAAEEDADMNFAKGIVDLSSLTSYEQAYTSAAKMYCAGFLKFSRVWRRT